MAFKLPGVVDHAVRGGDLCDTLMKALALYLVCTGMTIGVVPADEFPVSVTEIIPARRLVNAQHLERVPHKYPRRFEPLVATRLPGPGRGRATVWLSSREIEGLSTTDG